MRRSPATKHRYLWLQMIVVISHVSHLPAYKPLQTYSEGPRIFKISNMDLLMPQSNRKVDGTDQLSINNSTYEAIDHLEEQESLKFDNSEQSTIFVTPVNQIITTTSASTASTVQTMNDSDELNGDFPKIHQNHNNNSIIINSLNQQQNNREQTLTKLQDEEQMPSTGRAINLQYNHNNQNHHPHHHHHHHDINADRSPLIKLSRNHSPSLISPSPSSLSHSSPHSLSLSSIPAAAAALSESINNSNPAIIYRENLKDGISARFTPAEAVVSQHIKQAHYQSQYIGPVMSSTISALQNLYDLPPKAFAHDDSNSFAIEHQSIPSANGINGINIQNSYAAPPSGPIQPTYGNADQQQHSLAGANHNLYSNANGIDIGISQDNDAVGVLPASAMTWPTNKLNNENNSNKINNDILLIPNDDKINHLEETNFYQHYGNANAVSGIEDGMVFDTPPPDWQQHHIYSEDAPSHEGFHLDDNNHNDFHHNLHEFVTKAPPEGRVKKYSYFYIGRKLWYIPLYFTVWFSIYVLWLILKSISRHKVNLPNHYVSRRSSENDSRKLEAVNQMTENILSGIERFKAQYATVVNN